MRPEPLILDRIYEHEAARGDSVFLTQPVGSGRVVDITWGEMLHEARCMAAHLQGQGIRTGDRIALLAGNSAHFIIAELAIWLAGGTTVAMFPTESASNIRYVLEHSGASLLFLGKLDSFESQRPGIPTELPCIALPLAPQACLTERYGRWEGIVAHTPPLTGRPAREAGDLAMLVYTSGSTGQPKGVMHTFGIMARRMRAKFSKPIFELPPGVPWRMLSYLPLAHVYERASVACTALYRGDARIFFCESVATFMDDVKRARPTLFLSVPRLWLKFQQSVLATIPAAQLNALLDSADTAAVTGRKVLAQLGLDEVRHATSGSAPIAPELLDWYRRLGLDLFEGYAMSEDFCYSHVQQRGFLEPGHVGRPLPEVEVRLAADGEILIKSPGTMAGYYKRPDLDAECFTEDGFFRTGDLGERLADGQLRLIGRKKELFKTAKGKYIAPAPIENLLNAHPLIELSMVSGVGKPAPYAMVMLSENIRPKLSDQAVRDQVETALGLLLEEVNRSLANHERLAMLVIAAEPWSIENDRLTPTLKIKRGNIEDSAMPALETWYSAPGPVVWAGREPAVP